MNLFEDILNPWELPLLEGLHDAIECPFLDALMPFVSNFAKWGVGWIVLGLVLVCIRKTRKMGVTVLLSLLLGLLFCNGILKPLFARIRPYEWNTAITLLIPPESDRSFPSGHAVASFESAVAVFCYHKKWGAVALVLAGVIAFSRLYLLMHFFTDVLVGALVGILCGLLAYALVGLFCKKQKGFCDRVGLI